MERWAARSSEQDSPMGRASSPARDSPVEHPHHHAHSGQGTQTCHKQTRIMQHQPITHSPPHAQEEEHAAALIAAGCSHHFPASQAGAEQPGTSTLCRANEIRVPGTVWACEMGNGPNLTPRAHARIAKRLTQPAPADRRHREQNGGAPCFSLVDAVHRVHAHSPEVVSTAPVK